MLKMVESNYEIYKGGLFSRRSNNGRMAMWLSGMVGIILLGSFVIKVVFFRKVVGYLREKKVA